jgi:hypothetical protein
MGESGRSGGRGRMLAEKWREVGDDKQGPLVREREREDLRLAPWAGLLGRLAPGWPKRLPCFYFFILFFFFFIFCFVISLKFENKICLDLVISKFVKL